eukprot:m.100687 g.100687  ORF g.100687 m.100687 type:complete len:327 (-) comp15635_c0_seq2:803-1783(-)
MDDICPRQCLLLSSDTNLHGCLQHPGRTACIETLAVAGMSAATLILCLVQIVAAIRGKLQQRLLLFGIGFLELAFVLAYLWTQLVELSMAAFFFRVNQYSVVAAIYFDSVAHFADDGAAIRRTWWLYGLLALAMAGVLVFDMVTAHAYLDRDECDTPGEIAFTAVSLCIGLLLFSVVVWLNLHKPKLPSTTQLSFRQLVERRIFVVVVCSCVAAISSFIAYTVMRTTSVCDSEDLDAEPSTTVLVIAIVVRFLDSIQLKWVYALSAASLSRRRPLTSSNVNWVDEGRALLAESSDQDTPRGLTNGSTSTTISTSSQATAVRSNGYH